ncbi:MAG TPA: sulfotransferase [Xanthomonadales bacterium]|nr:sulfotransferase [Xanthomonadales bacterium]
MSTESLTGQLQAGLQQVSAIQRSGQRQQALGLLQEMHQQYPDQPAVLRMLGIALVQAGQLEQAEIHLRRASGLQPQSAMAASDHAGVLLGLGRFDQALDVLLASEPKLGPEVAERDRATFCFNLGRAFKQSGQAAEAEQPLLNTLEVQPQHYGALVVLGDVYKALGRADAAAGCYRQAIAEDPADGTGWWSLSNLKAGSFTEQEFLALQQLHAQKGRSPKQQTMFEFALANALDQRDQADQAFAHYQAGNQLAHQREPWDRRQFRQWLKALEQASADSGHLQSVAQRPASLSGPRPVFIISLPRSGSTLVEQVLAAHSQVTAASELPWIPQLVAAESARKKAGLVSWLPQQSAANWSSLGQDYLQKCRHWTAETPVFTDKLPGNLPYIGAILSMLPDALVVGVRREAMDVCWSCYRQLLMGGSEFVYDFPSLADYWHDFEAHLDFWEQQAPGRVMSVQYEALVRDPEAQTRRLLEFAGLGFELACLSPQKAKRAVNTASAMQVREPIHARGIGHWQRYASHLGELQRALQQQEPVRNQPGG